ncbi:MAG: alpha/beta hydrolase [Woeseiaceae bacterium]|jgi:pimeloyl-ACP methyl ester carboxylesterase
MTAIDTVVCVHGFWSHGTGMYLIKRRLEREFGFRALLFSYPSVRGSLDENAAALSNFIRDQDIEGVHIVGHSLGGVLALRMLANYPDALPGRIVCLGSPLTGSRAAEYLNAQVWAEDIIGRSLSAGVVEAAANEWASHVCERREIGVIAGNVPLGFGRLVANFREDNDGSVGVSETRLDGASDHLTMPVSHKGMLVSSDVADQAGSFLKRGEFLRDP